jgi:DNA repair photolyase
MAIPRVIGTIHGRFREILEDLRRPGALPSPWELATWEAEQGLSLRFRRGDGALEIDLDRADATRPCYTRTRLFNVYYTLFHRADASLSAHESALVERVVAIVRRAEVRLPALVSNDGEHDEHGARVAVREVVAERALLTESPGMYYVNPYTGCILGCQYCYGIGRTEFVRAMEDLPQLPWGRWLDVKVNAPALLARELTEHPPGTVRLSPLVTDPYQPVERKYRITRKCLEVLGASEFTPVVLTRSPVVTDDLALFRALPRLLIGVSIPTDDDDVRAAFEPAAPAIDDRIAALKTLREAGLRTFVVTWPMLPMDTARLVERVAPWVEAVRLGPMTEKARIARTYHAIGRPEAMTERWEHATFEALCEGFTRRSVPVNPAFEPWNLFR